MVLDQDGWVLVTLTIKNEHLEKPVREGMRGSSTSGKGMPGSLFIGLY